ncbi:adhesion G-protein coupled receptor G7-like [Ornithorhynchus anatinus]|uniref:adhesion G-protein coupled receptor G7-like n=1 Tax=Ornithorhynchus anatinus TaxID=9258 RepID=UPI0010A8149C|nr:adhesion G-protein coupled receptor G7-like [Ornithorhynchus anatinus]
MLTLGNVSILDCSQNLSLLEIESLKKENFTKQSQSISSNAQILTSDPSQLTPEEVKSATVIVEQMFDTSQNATAEAKETAVKTVSQLLSVSETSLERSAIENFTALLEGLKNYSLELGKAEAIVEPNIAVQSVNLSQNGSTEISTVLLSVRQEPGTGFLPNTSINTTVNSIIPNDDVELQILINVSSGNKSGSPKVGFVVYENDKLFHASMLPKELNYVKRVISATGGTLNATVEMLIKPQFNNVSFQLHHYTCVFWNLTTNSWDTRGCVKQSCTTGFLKCYCNHTTNFAVLMNFKKRYEYFKSLDTLSKIGSGLSICSLILTILFQVATRKTRKTSVTWVFVSLCTSMLIFNLLFVSGIENSNKNENKTEDNNMDGSIYRNKHCNETQDVVQTPENAVCTVIAAFLHYFLLVTFTWTGLNAVQLYFLLLRAIKPLPSHFTLILSLVGWGAPAVVVAITLGVAYSGNNGGALWYRKEELCWLAGSEDGPPEESNRLGIRNPMLWSFIVPVTLILISNAVIFIIITVNVLWKENQNLTKNKKISAMKKTLSTLSIAVVFGLTWILGYLMMLGDKNMQYIFSFAFCFLNSTQGLQIFIFYAVRTKIFQDKASELFKSMSESTAKLRSMSRDNPIPLHVKMYNMLKPFPARKEHFRMFEPSTEEVNLTESNQSFSTR